MKKYFSIVYTKFYTHFPSKCVCALRRFSGTNNYKDVHKIYIAKVKITIVISLFWSKGEAVRCYEILGLWSVTNKSGVLITHPDFQLNSALVPILQDQNNVTHSLVKSI